MSITARTMKAACSLLLGSVLTVGAGLSPASAATNHSTGVRSAPASLSLPDANGPSRTFTEFELRSYATGGWMTVTSKGYVVQTKQPTTVFWLSLLKVGSTYYHALRIKAGGWLGVIGGRPRRVSSGNQTRFIRFSSGYIRGGHGIYAVISFAEVHNEQPTAGRGMLIYLSPPVTRGLPARHLWKIVPVRS